jgi:signal peptidase
MTRINISKKQKKEAIIALVLVIIAVGGTFGLLGILRLSLKTDNPLVVVISDSMEPTIDVGDLLVIQGVNASEIEIGEIILYDSRGLWPPPNPYIPEPIVHRIVEKYLNDTDGKWYFYTLGDNNEGNIDPPDTFNVTEIPVPEDRVIGIVKTIIPKIGMVKIWMGKIPGLPTIILVGLSIALLISIVWDLMHPKQDEENEEELKEKTDIEPETKPEVDLGI